MAAVVVQPRQRWWSLLCCFVGCLLCTSPLLHVQVGVSLFYIFFAGGTRAIHGQGQRTLPHCDVPGFLAWCVLAFTLTRQKESVPEYRMYA
jgi:hypothetical protein